MEITLNGNKRKSPTGYDMYEPSPTAHSLSKIKDILVALVPALFM